MHVQGLGVRACRGCQLVAALHAEQCKRRRSLRGNACKPLQAGIPRRSRAPPTWLSLRLKMMPSACRMSGAPDAYRRGGGWVDMLDHTVQHAKRMTVHDINTHMDAVWCRGSAMWVGQPTWPKPACKHPATIAGIHAGGHTAALHHAPSASTDLTRALQAVCAELHRCTRRTHPPVVVLRLVPRRPPKPCSTADCPPSLQLPHHAPSSRRPAPPASGSRRGTRRRPGSACWARCWP